MINRRELLKRLAAGIAAAPVLAYLPATEAPSAEVVPFPKPKAKAKAKLPSTSAKPRPRKSPARVAFFVNEKPVQYPVSLEIVTENTFDMVDLDDGLLRPVRIGDFDTTLELTATQRGPDAGLEELRRAHTNRDAVNIRIKEKGGYDMQMQGYLVSNELAIAPDDFMTCRARIRVSGEILVS